MLEPEEGLPVKRVQAGLIELGRSVGPAGADGVFGHDTGEAVSAYKIAKGLQPSDPVVGPGTSKALDDDLFFDPPTLDPAFAEFSPFVVAGRVEPFVALELAGLIQTPLDSLRRVLASFTLTALGSGDLLGIVAQSRALGLKGQFLAVADDAQEGGRSADAFFDDEIISGGALGHTVIFASGGEDRSFIVIDDQVILGRASIVRTSTAGRARVTLQGVIVHELTHARNLANLRALDLTADTDTNAFADTALAQARSAAGNPPARVATARVLRLFVEEMVARHVHWLVLKEIDGTPAELASRSLDAGALAAALHFYFDDVSSVYDRNGYGAGITAQGPAMTFSQLELWARLCARQSFSDNAAQDEQSTLVFDAAADVCAAQVNTPTPLPDADGLFPLAADFV